MTVFTLLPQDVLQYEINHFLDPVSRANWNSTLNPNERVYKKFPKDYAIKHQIRVSQDAHNFIMKELNFRLIYVGWDLRGIKAVKIATQKLKAFFAFFHDPKNHVPLMYIKGRKENFITMLEQWVDPTDDIEFYDCLCKKEVSNLRELASKALSVVLTIPYIRNIS